MKRVIAWIQLPFALALAEFCLWTLLHLLTLSETKDSALKTFKLSNCFLGIAVSGIMVMNYFMESRWRNR